MKDGLPPFVSRWRDRHGTWRYRFRKSGHRSRMMPDPKYEAEAFAKAYATALGTPAKPKTEFSIATYADKYFASSAYANLATKTRDTYTRWIGSLCEEVGHTDIRDWTHGKAQALIDAHRSSPGRAIARKRALSLLFDLARKDDVIAVNHAKGVTLPKLGDGAQRWEAEHIHRFRAHWAVGTVERLALELFLWTGQRCADVMAMRRDHISDGFIQVEQQKTGKPLALPVHPAILEALAAAPDRGPYLLATKWRKKRGADGGSNWFNAAAKEALGESGYTAHGLRKTLASLLAEAGASDKVIQSITGHDTASETARYTKSADQKRLAEEAMRLLMGGEEQTKKMSNLDASCQTGSQTIDFATVKKAWQSLGESNPSFQVENLAS